MSVSGYNKSCLRSDCSFVLVRLCLIALCAVLQTGGLSNKQKQHKKRMPLAATRAKAARSRQEKQQQRKRSGNQFRGRKAWKWELLLCNSCSLVAKILTLEIATLRHIIFPWNMYVYTKAHDYEKAGRNLQGHVPTCHVLQHVVILALHCCVLRAIHFILLLWQKKNLKEMKCFILSC